MYTLPPNNSTEMECPQKLAENVHVAIVGLFVDSVVLQATYSQEIHFPCEEGYETSDGHDRLSATCGALGTWDELDDCLRK